MKSLPDRLNHVMKLRGIRFKKELADMAGISASAVTQWFTGDVASLGADTLMRLSKGLRVRPEWLNEGRGPVEPGEPEEVEVDWPFSFSVTSYRALPQSDRDEVEAIVKMKIKRQQTAEGGRKAAASPIRGGNLSLEEAVEAAHQLVGGSSAKRKPGKVQRN